MTYYVSSGTLNFTNSTQLKGICGGGEPCIRQIVPDCGCDVAKGSFAKLSREPYRLIVTTVTS